MRAAEEARRYYTLGPIWSACAGITSVPEATLDRMRRLYAGSIRYMDDWLGDVLESLDRAGLLDDTVVVVTSDHGENLGQGGLVAHAFSLDERLISVPLVIAGPGADGASISSLVELPRLVAELTGVDDHPWDFVPPAGCAVAQFDPLVAPDDPNPAASLAGLPPDAHAMLTTPLTCAVADGLKLVRRGEREELFDLVADPLEARPLPPEAVAEDGRGALLARLRGALEDPVMQRRVPVADVARSEQGHEVRDLEERMRLLGYL
jgi:arylsulfatase A-like enzyme